MKTWTRPSELISAPHQGTQMGLTIGNFDGVHKGHQKLLTDFHNDCKNYNLQSLVLTFNPHPKHIINPRDPYAVRLFDIRDLSDQMYRIGIDHLWIQEFSFKIAQLSPEDFIKDFFEILPIKFLQVGHDFRFGKAREGHISDLLSWCESKKIELKIFSSFEIEDQRVSTTLIRKFLMNAELDKILIFLGRRYYIRGEVKKGSSLGKGIGFPTANLNQPIPLKNGVYATKTYLRDKSFKSITNVGLRPTVNQNLDLWNKNVETHILERNIDLYDQEIKVEFFQFLRPEMKFASVDELKTQIQKDIQDLQRVNY